MVPSYSFFQKYGKAVVATLIAGLVVLKVAVSGDDGVSSTEWVQVCIALAGGVATYVVPLAPQWKWGKSFVNALLAVLLVLVTIIVGGLDEQEWIILVLAGLGTVGVGLAPAVSPTPEAWPDVVAPGGLDDGLVEDESVLPEEEND